MQDELHVALVYRITHHFLSKYIRSFVYHIY